MSSLFVRKRGNIYNVVIEFYQDANNSSKFLAAKRESYSAKFLKQKVEEWEESTIEK